MSGGSKSQNIAWTVIRFFDLREAIVKSVVVDLISINCEELITGWMQMKHKEIQNHKRCCQIVEILKKI